MSPAQDITAQGGQATSDPHAQLLSIQEKIAAQTGGQTPRLEGFDPKDKNLLEPPFAKASEGQVNLNNQNQKPGIRVNPLEIRANPSDAQTSSATQTPASDKTNPNAALELMKADIFKLLGMGQITETEKKKNLDEMEETIWQDFVEAELPEMLPAEQKMRFFDLLKTAPSAEKIINFFGNPPSGGLPKDFEQKYLRKTLDFKAEIVKEQIETLLLANAGKDAQKVELLQAAKAAADQGYWKKVEELMKQYPS